MGYYTSPHLPINVRKWWGTGPQDPRLPYLGACSTVHSRYTGLKKFVWVGQKKVRYKENSGI
jgi:hypothetical protein